MIEYLVIINIISFILYGLDKFLAIKKKFRISEISLFVVSIIGGCFMGIIGMKLFHHKTRKISFWIVNIISIILWIYIIIESR